MNYQLTTKTRTEAGSAPPPGARVIGLDLHPDTFAATIIEGSRPMEARVTYSRAGLPVAGIAAWAEKNLLPGDIAVCEAGSNSFEVLAGLRAAGFAGACLESRRVGELREQFADDRSASEKIARLYLSGLCKIVWEPDARTAERREVVGLHDEAVRGATRAKNSLRSYLNEHGVRLPKGTPLAKPAGEEVALCAYPWSAARRAMVSDLFAQVRHHEARRRAYRETIAREVASDPEILGLMRLLGINIINAYALVATIGDIRRFSSHKKLASYLGLAGGRERSGSSIDRKKRGTGRSAMRRLLVQAAQALLRSRCGGRAKEIREWGMRVFARRGQRAIAVIAVARKIVTQVYYQLSGRGRPELPEGQRSLRRKLGSLPRLLPRELLREAGFKTAKAWIDALADAFSSHPQTALPTLKPI